ncbi:MAG: energy transducer TonB [Flavobacteriales bacterium]|nr:energy transducer TonB [Flavobacteriales bacterium]
MVASEKTYGYIGTALYIILVFLLLWFFKMHYSKTIEIPAGGVDIDLGITATGMGENNPNNAAASSAAITESEQSMTNDAEEEDVVHTTKTPVKPTHQTQTTTPTKQNNSNEADDLWDQASKNTSSSQGNKPGKGDQGDPNGTDGSHGSTPCKGCTGGGNLGNGDATKLIVPQINNQDEGTIVVKVKIDKEGNVVDVKEYGNKGTVGNLSEESYRKAREAAFKTKFVPEPKAGELRTGYIKYNLQRN